MFHPNSRLIVTALTLLLGAYTNAGSAEHSACFIVFDFHERYLISSYGSDLLPAQEAIEKLIAGSSLLKRFPYWEFEPGNQDSYPRLRVWVEGDTTSGAWNVRMSIEPQPGVGERGNWTGVLYAPGDLDADGGWPAAANLPQKIFRKFDDNLAAKNESQIQAALQGYVPLVCAIAPPRAPLISKTAELRAALPLSWERYGSLAKSKFRIECDSPSGVINIFSEGAGRCIQFPGSASLQGLVVVYNEWEHDKIGQHLAELDQVRLRAIFLREETPVGQIPCDQTAPALAH